MNSKRGQNGSWLLATAKAVAKQLREQSDGTALRIRQPTNYYRTDTDGWGATVGNLGKAQPSLEIWYDRFAGYPDRKLYACFMSRQEGQIRALARRVSDRLFPVRVLTDADLRRGKIFVLRERLAREQFNEPVQEHYKVDRTHFFGIYDPTRETTSRTNPYFCDRAVAFFLDVVRLLPGAKDGDSQPKDYPRCENRKWVKSHLRRERSGYLAVQCKERDGYRCQVCKMTFAEVYAEELGAAFAEAHHLKPLGKQLDKVKTKLEELMTVCANCHRMLHRMEGKRDDVKRLRTLVRKHH